MTTTTTTAMSSGSPSVSRDDDSLPAPPLPPPVLSEAEKKERIKRFQRVTSKAISQAAQHASRSEYADAIETLVIAINLIKQSPLHAEDERRASLILQLQDTLSGVEKRSYAGGPAKSNVKRAKSDVGVTGARVGSGKTVVKAAKVDNGERGKARKGPKPPSDGVEAKEKSVRIEEHRDGKAEKRKRDGDERAESQKKRDDQKHGGEEGDGKKKRDDDEGTGKKKKRDDEEEVARKKKRNDDEGAGKKKHNDEEDVVREKKRNDDEGAGKKKRDDGKHRDICRAPQSTASRRMQEGDARVMRRFRQ